MKTIAIIPCHNEAEHIAKVVGQTKRYVDEVIVVNDGSTDTTKEQSKEADYVLSHIINLGKGAGMKTGFTKAIERNADIVIFIDGDGQHNPHDIPRFLRAMKENTMDIVVGKRAYNKNMPIVFKFGNWALNTMFTIFFHITIEDTQGGFRAIRTNIYKKIEWSSNGYAVETEMLAHAGQHNLRVTEIPIETIYLDTVKGTTIFDGLKVGWNMLRWKLGW